MTLRDELIQVAAVAVAIAQDLDVGSTGNTGGHLRAVLYQVEDERREQEKVWGPQHHSQAEWLAILAEEVGEAVRAIPEAEREPPLTDWDNMRWALKGAEGDARAFLKARFGQ